MAPQLNSARHRRRRGFSLIEVVIAIGVCTYALLVIGSLLPVGLATFQATSQQVIETEIFNQLWLQFNTTPFYSLQNANDGVAPIFPSAQSPVYYYYDGDGQQIVVSGSNPGKPSNAVYLVRVALSNSQTSPTPETTVPLVDGGLSTTGPSLTFIRVQIGFHFDPANVPAGKTDTRVATRTFLMAKRDTWDGS
jgi:uncharacterized protein (TIGR02598 family)